MLLEKCCVRIRFFKNEEEVDKLSLFYIKVVFTTGCVRGSCKHGFSPFDIIPDVSPALLCILETCFHTPQVHKKITNLYPFPVNLIDKIQIHSRFHIEIVLNFRRCVKESLLRHY